MKKFQLVILLVVIVGFKLLFKDSIYYRVPTLEIYLKYLARNAV